MVKINVIVINIVQMPGQNPQSIIVDSMTTQTATRTIKVTSDLLNNPLRAYTN